MISTSRVSTEILKYAFRYIKRFVLFFLFFVFFFFFHWKDQHFIKLMAPSESWGKTASKTHVKSFENIYCNVENHQRSKWTVFSQHCLGDEHEMSQNQKQNLKSHYKSSETNHHILIGFLLCSIISYYKREIAIYIELKLKTTTSERYQKISLVERP